MISDVVHECARVFVYVHLFMPVCVCIYIYMIACMYMSGNGVLKQQKFP